MQYSRYINSYYDDNFDEIRDQGGYARFKLYVFDSGGIDAGNLIDYEILNKNKLVSDSLLTKEYWIVNQTISPKYILEVEVSSYEWSLDNYYDFGDGRNRRLYCNRQVKGRIVSCKTILNDELIDYPDCITNEDVVFDWYFRDKCKDI